MEKLGVALIRDKFGMSATLKVFQTFLQEQYMLGLYPTWFEPGVGSGWIIGFIATIHVLFSHASVGGGILFAWLANYAVRKDRPVYLSFIPSRVPAFGLPQQLRARAAFPL